MRLDKWLSHAGLGSRSQVKTAVRKGQVKINGIAATDSGTEVKPEDEVSFRGKIIGNMKTEQKSYLMMNKPKGYVCATQDGTEQTVMELLPSEMKDKVFPVGRLDKDTEGLLILTDDGELCHRLISPKNHIGKTYIVHCRKPVTKEDLQRFREGITIGEGETSMPAEAKTEAEDDKILTLTIYEGRYHQVKRMLKATCNKVVTLKRINIGEVMLDAGLKPGEWRELTKEEITKLNEK